VASRLSQTWRPRLDDSSYATQYAEVATPRRTRGLVSAAGPSSVRQQNEVSGGNSTRYICGESWRSNVCRRAR
jgi:hypothetical protein